MANALVVEAKEPSVVEEVPEFIESVGPLSSVPSSDVTLRNASPLSTAARSVWLVALEECRFGVGAPTRKHVGV